MERTRKGKKGENGEEAELYVLRSASLLSGIDRSRTRGLAPVQPDNVPLRPSGTALLSSAIRFCPLPIIRIAFTTDLSDLSDLSLGETRSPPFSIPCAKRPTFSVFSNPFRAVCARATEKRSVGERKYLDNFESH